MGEESELKMVRRHIREGAKLVARQRRRVASLDERDALAESAVQLLEQLEKALTLHEEHLAILLRRGHPDAGA